MSDRDRRQDKDLPHREAQDMDEEARRKRDKLDDVPPHGTDPLHEGP
jgi:hypothetical protein